MLHKIELSYVMRSLILVDTPCRQVKFKEYFHILYMPESMM